MFSLNYRNSLNRNRQGKRDFFLSSRFFLAHQVAYTNWLVQMLSWNYGNKIWYRPAYFFPVCVFFCVSLTNVKKRKKDERVIESTKCDEPNVILKNEKKKRQNRKHIRIIGNMKNLLLYNFLTWCTQSATFFVLFLCSSSNRFSHVFSTTKFRRNLFIPFARLFLSSRYVCEEQEKRNVLLIAFIVQQKQQNYSKCIVS